MGEIDIVTTQEASEIQKGAAEVVGKRGRKSNWTDALEECDQRVDYSTFDPNIFNSKFYLTILFV